MKYFKVNDLNNIIADLKNNLAKEDTQTTTHDYSPESVVDVFIDYYVKSRRQDICLSLPALFLKSGKSEKDTRETIRILVKKTQDEEATKRFKAVDETIKKYRTGKNIKGIKVLAEFMSPEDLLKLKKLLGCDTPDINNPYVFYNGGTYIEKFDRGESRKILLGNLQAEIIEEITYDDGAETKKFYVITGTDSRGNKLSTLTVPVEKFNSLSWISEWGSVVIIEPGYSYKDHLRCAIQKHSNNIEYRTIYGHTGWRSIDGQWYYLHHGGAICEDGNIEDIEVDLNNKLSSHTNHRFDSYRFEDSLSGESLKHAITSSLSILELAPYAVTYPIFSAVFSSVLNEIISTHLSIIIVGRTGCQKTELCAIAQAFFGKGFNSSTLPANWSSTANALEKQSYICKDGVLVIDDFAPSGTKYDVNSSHKIAERLFRGAGNRSGRARMRPDGSSQPTYFPRGLIIASGEDTPRGHSLLSRLITIELSTGDVDLEKLTIAQQNAGDGVFANCMSSYLKWVAPRLDDLREKAKSRHQYYRDFFRNLNITHDRTPDNFAILAVGFENFLKFASEVGAITQSASDKYMQDFFDVCKDLMESQKGHLSDQDPVDTFLSVLPEALLSGYAHIANFNDGGKPRDHRNAYGWINNDSYSGWGSRGKLIGYVDEDNEDIFLLSEITYSVISDFCYKLGNNFSTSSQTLWKRLRERRLLASTDQNQSAIRKTILGNRIRVLHFKISALLSLSSPPSPDSPPKSSSVSIHDENDFHIQTFTDFDEEKG